MRQRLTAWAAAADRTASGRARAGRTRALPHLLAPRGGCGSHEAHALDWLDLDVTQCPQQQGDVTHTITAKGRAVRDAVQQLARHALPSWDAICAGAARPL